MSSESRVRGQGCAQVLRAVVQGEAAHPDAGATRGVGEARRGVQGPHAPHCPHARPQAPLHSPSPAVAAQRCPAEEQPSARISLRIAQAIAAGMSSKEERLWVWDCFGFF